MEGQIGKRFTVLTYVQVMLLTENNCSMFKTSFSQSIPLAPITSQNPTLPTLKYILRKGVIAFFTSVWSGNIKPTSMSAIMPFSEVRNSLINLSLSDHTTLGSTASDDLVRSSYEAIFVPLVTRTDLPALPANVTIEISDSCGKRKRGGTRIVRCRDSCNSRQ